MYSDIYMDEFFIALMGIIMIIAIVALVLGIVVYICTGLALFTVGKAEGIPNKWLAWIPIGSNYVILKSGEKNANLIWVYLGTTILSVVGSFLGYGDSPIALVFTLASFGLAIWQIVISIICFLTIGKKYGMSPAWFIVGLFIVPVMIPAFIILYNKASKVCKGQQAINNDY